MVKNAKNVFNFLDGIIAVDEIIETLLEQWQLLAFFLIQELSYYNTLGHFNLIYYLVYIEDLNIELMIVSEKRFRW